MKISILAAGAGGMYCGSCLRDNSIATALKRMGHDVTLIPLYTPLRTDTHTDSIGEVFYGGVNVYLQHLSSVFRHTPRVLDWVFDRPWLLGVAGRLGAQTPPEKLAGMTLSILEGEEGAALKELNRLVRFLRDEIKPEVVCLPNLMFVGMAQTFARELGVPVVCEMTGEDIFLDGMKAEDRQQLRGVIRSRAADVSRFVATSHYYAGRMADYLGVPVGEIDVVYTGVSPEYLSPALRPADMTSRPPTVGYLARVCKEKGFDQILQAMTHLLDLPGMSDAKLIAAGYVGSRDEKWAKDLLQALPWRVRGAVTFLGEVDLDQKLAMLDSIDVFSVPTNYPESKGVYVLESLSRGVPVVLPRHGAFPELIEQTGGGVLFEPNDPHSLALALAQMLQTPDRGKSVGLRGRAVVLSSFTDEHMAVEMLKTLRNAVGVSSSQSLAEEKMVESPVQPSLGVSTPASNSTDTLQVRSVGKDYPTPTTPLVVLKGVSFSLAQGHTLAIVGPSGSGKSTLLNILGTLDHPTTGEVTLDGVNPAALKPAKLAHFRSSRIGFVFQDHHLLPQCTAIENVLLARMAAGRVDPNDVERARQLLDKVGLSQRATHLPAELSGGERQRVAIARALMNEPSLLLCDEPTGNLDTHTATSIADLLLSVVGPKTMLIAVTHSEAFAARFARRLRMTDGVLLND